MSARQSNKIWLLLLPNWVERKPYFEKHVGTESSRLFFIAPVKRYVYKMPLELVGESKPEWVGDDGGISPYDSTWYCHLPKDMDHEKFYAALEKHKDNKKEWLLARSMKAIRWKMKKAGKVSGPLSSLAVPTTAGSTGDSLKKQISKKKIKAEKFGFKNKKKNKVASTRMQIAEAHAAKHIPGTVAFD